MPSLTFDFECPPEDSQCLQDCVENCCNTCKCECCACGAPNTIWVKFTGIANIPNPSTDTEWTGTRCDGDCTELNDKYWPSQMHSDYCFWTGISSPCMTETGFEINCDPEGYDDINDCVMGHYDWTMQTGIWESNLIADLNDAGTGGLPFECIGAQYSLSCLTETASYPTRKCEYRGASVVAYMALPEGAVSEIWTPPNPTLLQQRLSRPDIVSPYLKKKGTLGLKKSTLNMGNTKLTMPRNRGVICPKCGPAKTPSGALQKIKKRKLML